MKLATISGGWSHFCGITADSTAYCWGENLYGELGDGTTSRRFGSAQFQATPVATSRKFIAITAAVYATCALDGSGKALCWGRNDYGALGKGYRGEGSVSTVPEPVATSQQFVSVDGSYPICGITREAQALCWGMIPGSFNPIYRAPGNCSTAYYIWYIGDSCYDPTPLSGNTSFNSVTAGECGVSPDQRAFCWGDGYYGQLGNGLTGSSSVDPVEVVGGHRFSQVSAGSSHACGLTTEGQALCWGANMGGQLGLGSDGATGVPTQPVPMPVVTSLRFLTIAAGGNTCALSVDREVWCWGSGYGNLPVRVQLTSASSPRLSSF